MSEEARRRRLKCLVSVAAAQQRVSKKYGLEEGTREEVGEGQAGTAADPGNDDLDSRRTRERSKVERQSTGKQRMQLCM